MNKDYVVKSYVYLVKLGKRDIDSIPEKYRADVAEALVAEAETSGELQAQ